jgi:DNA polymerase elongation subunit (family B)
MIIDIEQEKSELSISYFNKEGGVSFKNIRIPESEMFNWEYCLSGEKSQPEVKSWDDKPVKKRRAKYITNFRVIEFIESLPMETTAELYEYHTPKKWFLDIEVEIGEEWPKAETAKYPVTAIAFCRGERMICMGLKDLSAQQIQRIEQRMNQHLEKQLNGLKMSFSYLKFSSEYDMLVSFFHKAILKMPLLTGWNFVQFDWQYLVNRCKKLGVDTRPSSLSGKLVGKSEFPMHRLVLDYLDIYKKWDKVVEIKENNTLDFVANSVLGIQKVKYDGSLQELYNNDFESYIFYNVVDTKLVELIDEKINTMQTFLTLANITKVEINRAFSPIYMAEAAMCRECLNRNKVIPKKDKIEKKKGKYEGAFVVDPKAGLYEWVGSLDFASLYPFIMRQWNISPDSYLRHTRPGETVDLDKEILTTSGAVFSKKEDSILRTVLTDYYNRRKQAKREYEAIEAEIQYLEQQLNS